MPILLPSKDTPLLTLGVFAYKGNVWNTTQYCSWVDWVKGEILDRYGEETVLLPVYMTGNEISITPAVSPWHSEQIGWMFATPEVYQSRKLSKQETREILKREISMIDKYYRGKIEGMVLYTYSLNGAVKAIEF